MYVVCLSMAKNMLGPVKGQGIRCLDMRNLQEQIKKSILLPKIDLTFHCLNKLFCRQSRAWALDHVDGTEEADATQVEEVFHLRPPKKKPGPIQFSSLFSSVCTNVQTSYFRHQGKTCKIHNQPHCRLQVGCEPR